jgi:hypothetical protein
MHYAKAWTRILRGVAPQLDLVHVDDLFDHFAFPDYAPLFAHLTKLRQLSCASCEPTVRSCYHLIPSSVQRFEVDDKMTMDAAQLSELAQYCESEQCQLKYINFSVGRALPSMWATLLDRTENDAADKATLRFFTACHAKGIQLGDRLATYSYSSAPNSRARELYPYTGLWECADHSRASFIRSHPVRYGAREAGAMTASARPS